jgi:hypothetical protein
MGDLEPSSIQAGSGEQFKRKKSISVGGRQGEDGARGLQHFCGKCFASVFLFLRG